MGVGISCKNGLNLHLGEMLTNYATSKFESRRKKKELDAANKSKSETSLFTIVSTKSTDERQENQFDPRKRQADHRLDEHQASQPFLDVDAEDKVKEDQVAIKNRLKTILDEANVNKLNEEPDENVGGDDVNEDNCSTKTILNTSLTELDDATADENEENLSFKLNNELKRLSSIKEESHLEVDKEIDKEVDKKVDKEVNKVVDKVKHKVDYDVSESKNKLPKKSSVKVQMSSLNVPSAQTNEYSIYPTRAVKKSKMKQQFQNLRFKSEQETVKDESSSDEQLKGVDLDEKQRVLNEMLEMARREPFKLENYSFSNAINDQLLNSLPRSFSADCISDYIRDLNELNQPETSFDLNDKHCRLIHLSESDLSKLKELDSESIKTENLNLDSIDNELFDRDQLDSVILDSNDDFSRQDSLVGRNNRLNMQTRLKDKSNLKGGLPRHLLTDAYILMLSNKQGRIGRLVTKTNRKENVNKRSLLVNSWLTNIKDQRLNCYREECDDNQFSEFWNTNQSSSSSNHPANQQLSPFNSDYQNCFDADCKLCRLNEEQIHELDSDVLQLMNILKTLDGILYEKERQLQQLADQVEKSPSHSTICTTNKLKLIRTRANLKKKVKMLKQRSTRLGISMMKSEEGKQLVVFKDGKSTYQIEIGEGNSESKTINNDFKIKSTSWFIDTKSFYFSASGWTTDWPPHKQLECDIFTSTDLLCFKVKIPGVDCENLNYNHTSSPKFVCEFRVDDENIDIDYKITCKYPAGTNVCYEKGSCYLTYSLNENKTTLYIVIAVVVSVIVIIILIVLHCLLKKSGGLLSCLPDCCLSCSNEESMTSSKGFASTTYR